MAGDYLKFWTGYGLKYITPGDRDNPEGFDLGEIFDRLKRPILELGCGRGRLAKFFAPEDYLGVDINPNAVRMARERNPDHRFEDISVGDPLPRATTTLAYTVFFHIPDVVFPEVACSLNSEYLLIGEFLDPALRDGGQGYRLSNHRSLADYKEFFGEPEWVENRLYERYNKDVQLVLWSL